MAEVCLVTGAAGFIGSHLVERLLREGYQVIGVDCFTDYYPRAYKERNLSAVRENPRFAFVEADLCAVEVGEWVQQADYVLHLAAQPGVRGSWGANFEVYTRNNILATQRLLEAARNSELRKFVFASSSSVYGNVATLPVDEAAMPRPYSPYGVTKLAAEHLCHLYHDNYGVPTVALRYFTVYGPRQRPDMAFYRFIKAIATGREVSLYGDGSQTRDFTYVDDVVEANLLAMRSPVTGRAFNIGGGARVTVRKVICMLEEILGKRAKIVQRERQHGDAGHTWADITAAQRLLGFHPRMNLYQGLVAQAEWLLKDIGPD